MQCRVASSSSSSLPEKICKYSMIFIVIHSPVRFHSLNWNSVNYITLVWFIRRVQSFTRFHFSHRNSSLGTIGNWYNYGILLACLDYYSLRLYTRRLCTNGLREAWEYHHETIGNSSTRVKYGRFAFAYFLMRFSGLFSVYLYIVKSQHEEKWFAILLRSFWYFVKCQISIDKR